MTLGSRICAQRTALGLSQVELAEQLEVSRQSISKWETDASVPELDKLVKMCQVFDVSLDQLVLGRGPVRTPSPLESFTLTPQLAGAVLLLLGLVAFLLTAAVSQAFASGVLLALPFLACGGLCFLVQRGLVLCCGWVVWVSLLCYIQLNGPGLLNGIGLLLSGLAYDYADCFLALLDAVLLVVLLVRSFPLIRQWDEKMTQKQSQDET